MTKVLNALAEWASSHPRVIIEFWLMIAAAQAVVVAVVLVWLIAWLI